MRLPFLSKRLIARLAFLASLMFALGLWPKTLLVTTSAGQTQGQINDEEEEVHSKGAVPQRRAEGELEADAQRVRERVRLHPGAPVSLRAVPFVAKQRAQRAPPRVLYKPFLRLLC